MSDTPTTDPKPGIACPQCGCRHFDVVKIVRATGYLRRRRECRNCGRRVTTSERIVGSK
jgi:transcriptional regulator NrdR family protein